MVIIDEFYRAYCVNDKTKINDDTELYFGEIYYNEDGMQYATEFVEVKE